jgi:DNA-binding NarL/FixJ family response regulator
MRDDILLPYLHPRVCETARRVLLTGDHSLIRTALGLLISANGMTVVGECSNDPAAVRAFGHMVDLVILDVDLDTHGWTRPEKLGPLLGAAKGLPVLIVTRGGDSRGISAALQHGALGVVLKNRPPQILMRAIRAVLAGEVWLERSMVTSFFYEETTAPRGPSVMPERLTRRETQVVELVSLGLPNKQIAARLSIAENTVRHHLTSIFDKLAVTNRAQLMRYTLDAGPTAP